VKPVLLCLLLLPACSFVSSDFEPETYEYVLTWYCVSPAGCERTGETARIDHANRIHYAFYFTSTQDPSFDEAGDLLFVDSLPDGCAWLYYLSFFGHELERSRICFDLGGFELQLSIPNQDPSTQSEWVVSGRDLKFL
jgi:hypothetical protein